jgi:hypothetical protein
MQTINVQGKSEMQINVDEVYVLIPKPGGKCWTWKNSPSGFVDKREYSNVSNMMSAMGYSTVAVQHTLDPITAISHGLITVDDLVGLYPPGFTALLNVLKVN